MKFWFATLLGVLIWGLYLFNTPALGEASAGRCSENMQTPVTPVGILESIFGSRLPQQYQVLRSGEVTRALPKGQYLLLSNPSNQTMALVVRTEALLKSDPLLDPDLSRLAYHLFDNYIFCKQGYQISEKNHQRLWIGRNRTIVRYFDVAFIDGFMEPDAIARLKLPHKRQLIVMLGQPQMGHYRSSADFSASFAHLQQEMKKFLQAYLDK